MRVWNRAYFESGAATTPCPILASTSTSGSPSGGGAVADRSDIERGMRPCRLGQVFDDAGNMIVAFDQQHVAGLQGRAQRVGIRRREWLIALHRLFQIVGEKAPNPIDHPAHNRPSAPILGAQDVPRAAGGSRRYVRQSPNLVRTHCNLVHRRPILPGSSRSYRSLAIKIAGYSLPPPLAVDPQEFGHHMVVRRQTARGPTRVKRRRCVSLLRQRSFRKALRFPHRSWFFRAAE